MEISGILALMGDPLYKRRYQNASICIAKHYVMKSRIHFANPYTPSIEFYRDIFLYVTYVNDVFQTVQR